MSGSGRNDLAFGSGANRADVLAICDTEDVMATRHEESAASAAAKGGKKGCQGGKGGKRKGANGWTCGAPESRTGWKWECGMAHDRFAHKNACRYDFFGACSDGCLPCVQSMVYHGWVAGNEQSHNMGYTGLDFAVYARQTRRVKTAELEQYLRSIGVEEKAADD